jgi:hypothetical protein
MAPRRYPPIVNENLTAAIKSTGPRPGSSPLEGDGFEPSVPRHADLIVVDDQLLPAQDALRAATAYRALRRRFLDIQLWPGDRGAAEPEHLAGPQGDERFVIAYRLRNLCHACAVIGCVRYAFDIDHSAKFLGTNPSDCGGVAGNFCYNRYGTCWQPYVKGLTIMIDSLHNGNRMEDVWMDK